MLAYCWTPVYDIGHRHIKSTYTERLVSAEEMSLNLYQGKIKYFKGSIHI